MLTQSNRNIDQIVGDIPKEWKTIDVGGAVAPFKRADYILDLISYSQIAWNQTKGPGEVRFTEKTYVQFDICSREKFPFADKEFDYSFCSHTLEDIRDPLWVCSELIRISKAGYIEIPSRHYETTFGAEAKNLAGNSHHHWIIDVDPEKKLRFTFKHMQVHSKAVNKNRSKYTKPKNGQKAEDTILKIEWKDSFDYYENWLNSSGKKVFEYFLGREITEKEKWWLYYRLDPRPFPLGLLSYLKNTTGFFKKISEKFLKN